MENNISVQEFIKTKDKYFIIDMRDRTAYQHGHIDGAVSSPGISAGEIMEMMKEHHKKEVIIYCSIGENSKRYADELRKFKIPAWSLEGGYREWLLAASEELSGEEVKRYSRQMILPQVGEEGQKSLKQAKVLVVGAGGLGSPALMYLTAAGVGRIGISDGDRVEITNLHRQCIHDTASVGEKKIQSAKSKLDKLNPNVDIRLHDGFLLPENIENIIDDYDFVIDGVDNFESKFLINDACVIHKKPFCHAGILKFQGQVMTWLPGQGACYRCIFEDVPKGHIPDCSEAGIIGAVAGIIGSIQALEAIKYIIGLDGLLTGRMFIFDGLNMNARIVKFGKNSEHCKVCGAEPKSGFIEKNKKNYYPQLCMS